MKPGQRVLLLDLSRDLAAARVKAGTIAGTFEPGVESALLYLIGDELNTLARRTDAILETDAIYHYYGDRPDLRAGFCLTCNRVTDHQCIRGVWCCRFCETYPALALVTDEKQADARHLAVGIRADWDTEHGMDEVI